jgi:hypothetical protein
VTDRGWTKWLPTVCLIDADCFQGALSRMPRFKLQGPDTSFKRRGGNAQKNSGGGIAPAAN